MHQRKPDSRDARLSPGAFRPLSLSALSSSRRALVELMRRRPYCRILGLVVRDGEPILPPSAIIRTVKTSSEDRQPPSTTATDYVLKKQVVRLLDELDHMESGIIESITVADGLPLRVEIRESGEFVVASVGMVDGGIQ